MKTYSVPSIASLDSSNLHFFKNQATCDSGILNGQTLAEAFDGDNCGFGNAGTNTLFICLSGSVDPSLLEGLIGNTINGDTNQEFNFQTISCAQDNSNCSAGYVCTVNGAYPDNGYNPCITSLTCPDGTVIDICSDTSDCAPPS
jgi:hypothetical protein